MPDAVGARLKVETRGSEAVARLIFFNKTDGLVVLDKFRAVLDGKLRSKVFTISTERSLVRYTGILVKREPRPEDLVQLRSGQTIETRVPLNSSYAFLAGTHVYTIRYEAFHPDPAAQDLREIRSNDASFKLTLP
jgi:hypothetical protein